jgi:spore germination protein PD
MIYEVYNRDLCVENIKIIGVASSSLVMVGDTQTIQLAATFDTPAESLIIGPFVPLAPEVT